MSYTAIYAIPASGPVENIAEFRNAWGVAAYVWSGIALTYMGSESAWLNPKSCNRESDFWKFRDDPRLSDFERLVFVWTFDYAITEAAKLNEMADCMEAFVVKYPPGNRVCHLPEIAALYRRIAAVNREGLLGLGVYQNSVSEDPWYKRNEETKESVPYDASINDDHWLVFEHYGRRTE